MQYCKQINWNPSTATEVRGGGIGDTSNLPQKLIRRPQHLISIFAIHRL